MFSSALSQHLTPLNILVVEDDPVMQLGIQQVLRDYSCLSLLGMAKDGATGVKMALELKPDVVLMDIGLPKLDGIEATRRIKAKSPEVGVVLLTCHQKQAQVRAALGSGAEAYCIKGAKVEQLLSAIAAARDGALYLDPKVAGMVVEEIPQSMEYLKNVKLSERELQVLKLLVEGKRNAEIAADLYLSPHTVKTHVRNIMDKLVASDRVGVAVTALRAGLVN
ncbi:response regulator transcription factor [Spirulina sp. 06S082]|uniref:response regulator transcription factor n=1 Tax=Spirulina sp. 06S082 TaxID=3110248 RepID=UPI002B21F9DD|nr:response regulator transcription factor [Spirulina sp. 06S082]MEA5469697.1 response regulator transcription factor [Spirulina sp. 06S082]